MFSVHELYLSKGCCHTFFTMCTALSVLHSDSLDVPFLHFVCYLAAQGVFGCTTILCLLKDRAFHLWRLAIC